MDERESISVYKMSNLKIKCYAGILEIKLKDSTIIITI